MKFITQYFISAWIKMFNNWAKRKEKKTENKKWFTEGLKDGLIM